MADRYDLTDRQREILTLVADGVCRQQIAATLHISLETVKSHLKAIRLRLGATNNAHAVASAMRRNMIQ